MLRRVAAILIAATLLTACQSATLPKIPPLPNPPAAQASRTPAPAVTLSVGPGPAGPTQAATVVYVTDGDTIHVDIDGTEYRLRYIGMNAPETVDPDKPIEPGGPQASAANKALVDGQRVWLEKDVSETDQFGRLLRYVWLQTDAGWVMVDRQLVLEGWAFAKAYPPDTKYQDLLFDAQSAAQAAGVGMWAPNFQSPGPTSGAVHLLGPGATVTSGCDPSYPTVCIPPPPPDLDCADIAYRHFTVLPPDPDHFDGDHNGIGCEADGTPVPTPDR